jgi:hypothetical protein
MYDLKPFLKICGLRPCYKYNEFMKINANNTIREYPVIINTNILENDDIIDRLTNYKTDISTSINILENEDDIIDRLTSYYYFVNSRIILENHESDISSDDEYYD